MIWLTSTKYPYHRWQWISSDFHEYKSVPTPVVNNRLRLHTGFDYWVTRRVPLLAQELLTLPEHLNSSWFLKGSCYFSFSFQCNVVCSMFVFHFILLAMVLPVFRLNDFCLSLWYLQIPFSTHDTDRIKHQNQTLHN